MSALMTLLRFRLRRDRVQLPVWIISTGLLLVFTSASLAHSYGSEANRVAVLKVAAGNPTLLALRGPVLGSSMGAFTAFEILSFIALLAALMNTFLAVRHSRADEESGRSELVSATAAGRLTPTIATVLEGVIANVVLMVVLCLILLASGLDFSGSATFGWVVGATGLAFLGVGLLCAQIFSTARASNGAAAALVGIAYVLRGIGDASGTPSADGLRVTSGLASWFSPIGWAQQSQPFTANAWWTGLLGLGLGILAVVITLGLQSVRDHGAGLVAARSGRASASALLGGPLGLAWRLQRASILGWAIAAIFGALLAGKLGAAVVTASAKDQGISTAMRSFAPSGSGAILQVFVAAMMGIIGLVVAGCMLQTVMRLRQEEAAGTAEVVLATGVARISWLLGYLLMGALSAVLIMLLGGLITGALLAQVSGSEIFGQSVASALVQLPAAFVYMTVLGFVFALTPRLTIGAGWAMLALGAFLGQFGGLLQLPGWLRSISPFEHTPALPLAHADFSGAIGMIAVSLLATIAAAWLFRRRDLAIG